MRFNYIPPEKIKLQSVQKIRSLLRKNGFTVGSVYANRSGIKGFNSFAGGEFEVSEYVESWSNDEKIVGVKIEHIRGDKKRLAEVVTFLKNNGLPAVLGLKWITIGK